MANNLKFIGKQLLIFAFIASVFNMYALEVWCGLTMGPRYHQAASADHHLAKDSHASGKMADCPHQSKSEGEKEKQNSCEDHHDFFATSVSGSGLQKFFAHSGDPDFIHPKYFTFIAARPFSQVTLPVNLFSDVGLKPKAPDIRIFICSLTI